MSIEYTMSQINEIKLAREADEQQRGFVDTRDTVAIESRARHKTDAFKRKRKYLRRDTVTP